MCGYNDCERRREADLKSHVVRRNEFWMMTLFCFMFVVTKKISILLLMRRSSVSTGKPTRRLDENPSLVQYNQEDYSIPYRPVEFIKLERISSIPSRPRLLSMQDRTNL